MFGKELDQLHFLFVRHAAAEGVVEVGQRKACMHRSLLQRIAQGRKAHAGDRVSGYFKRLQAEVFNDLEQVVKDGCFDGHRVSGAADDLQGEQYGFQAAAGGDDLVRCQ